MKRIDKGIRRHPDGRWEVFVRVGKLPLVHRHLPASMDLRAVREWRDDKRAELRRSAPSAARGTLAADVGRYLARLPAGLLRDERERYLALWSARFGHRVRHTIKTPEIAAVMDEWTAAGLAASTVKHRRMALLRLFDTLDEGLDLPNPVKRAKPPREPEPEPRGLPIWLVDALMAALSTKGTPGAAGGKRGAHSKARARLMVIAHTGIRPEEVARIRPEDWRRSSGELFVRAAKGSVARVIPLSPQASAALAELERADALGQFSRSNLRRSIRSALERVRESVPPELARELPAEITTYDLRHSFATALWLATGDRAAVQEYLGHKSDRMTRRYTKAAAPAILRSALTSLDRHRAESKVTGESHSAGK